MSAARPCDSWNTRGPASMQTPEQPIYHALHRLRLSFVMDLDLLPWLTNEAETRDLLLDMTLQSALLRLRSRGLILAWLEKLERRYPRPRGHREPEQCIPSIRSMRHERTAAPAGRCP